VSLAAIYALAQGHPRVQGRLHWKARIRATIESGPYVRTGEGLWSPKAGFSDAEVARLERQRRKRWPLLGPREDKN
jgi:hypothetical protein